MPKKDAAPKMIGTKASFFMPRREMVENKPKEISVAKPFHQQAAKRFVFDQGTGVAYAEIIGNSIVCLETGLEIRRIGEEDDSVSFSGAAPFQRRFDYSPPEGMRHPDDKTVDVAALVRFGILSEDAIQSRRPFTREELDAFMAELARRQESLDLS